MERALVWAYAADRLLAAGEPLPLAVFPEPCVYRESAVAALGTTDRAWRIVFESSSMAGCLPAARFYVFAGNENPVGAALIEAARRAGQSRFAVRGLRG